MTGLDTSQAITDHAALGDEKLLHHPHLETAEHAADQPQSEPAEGSDDD